MSKVLIVFNHPAPYKVKLFNELAKHIDLTVIFERDKASDRNKSFYEEKEYKFNQVKIKGIKLGRENIISSGIVKHLKKNYYDLIIMNGYSQFAEMKTIDYLVKHNIPYTLYINGGIVKTKECSFKRRLKTKYISHAQNYLSPDENSNNYLVYYGANKSMIYNYPYSTIYEDEILANPIGSELKFELKEKAKIQDRKIFVSCGQLIKRKNYLELIKKWQEVNPEYGLYIIGDGKEKQHLENYINEKNIHNVHLLGYMKRKDLFDFYHLCDAFIFPSDEDIYGHVINEAMSQGLPVISTPNVNASRKLIKEGFNGYMINSLENDELLTAIDKVIKDNLSNNALETARENTIEKMVEAHLDILKRIETK